jgi:predicted HD phosphohydrolase
MVVTPAVDLDDLFEWLARCEGRHGGDPVDILEHSLQCADRLAEVVPDDVELQLAGLTHDVGHILPGAHSRSGEHAAADQHGEAGAQFVAAVLGIGTARLVELHVPAKRYLVATDPTHASRLSEGSTTSLAAQGGPMDAREVAAFEADPDRTRAVALRRADEAAKDPGAATSTLHRWRATAEEWLG